MYLDKHKQKEKEYIRLQKEYNMLMRADRNVTQEPLSVPLFDGYVFTLKLDRRKLKGLSKKVITGIEYMEKEWVNQYFNREKYPTFLQNYDLEVDNGFMWDRRFFKRVYPSYLCKVPEQFLEFFQITIVTDWLEREVEMAVCAIEYRKYFRIARDKQYVYSVARLDGDFHSRLAEVRRKLEQYPEWKFGNRDRHWESEGNRRRNFRQSPIVQDTDLDGML